MMQVWGEASNAQAEGAFSGVSHHQIPEVSAFGKRLWLNANFLDLKIIILLDS